MNLRKHYSLLALIGFSGSANATAVPVPEPGMVSLLGLGAIVTVLVIRYFRK